VRYTAIASFTKDTPPLRNYCIVYHLYNIKGRAWGFEKHLTLQEHFDCPGDPNTCKKRGECFIDIFGNSLLSLSTATLIAEDNILKEGEFTQKERERIAERDLAREKGMLCLVDSEAIVICSPEKFEMDIGGQRISCDEYWRNIIKGFALLLGCKTMAQIIGRLLLECTFAHRVERGYKKIEEIQEELGVVSNLLGRTRLTIVPSNIARATYVREKFKEFTRVIGLPEIVKGITEDYEEIDRSINTYINAERTEMIKILTWLLIPLTLVIGAFEGREFLGPPVAIILAALGGCLFTLSSMRYILKLIQRKVKEKGKRDGQSGERFYKRDRG
jgi:hypothetical protein